MTAILSYCGLLCSDCPAYIATQANDPVALEQVVAQWRDEFGAQDMTVDSIRCDGCLGSEGSKMSHWYECEIRACAMASGVLNCGHCASFACDKLETFFGLVPDARVRLTEVHAQLAS